MSAICSGRLSRRHFAAAGPSLRMKKKRPALAGNHIGLWDSVQSCHRVGSLDSAIKNAVPNDFAALLKQYPRTQRLLFNGQKAFGLFERFYPDILEYVDYEVLPSTSPANAAVPYEKKLELWREALRGRAVSGRC